MTKRFLRRLIALLAASAVVVLSTVPAAGQVGESAALETNIREVSFDTDGRTRVVVSVAGTALGASPLGGGDFAVTEDGKPVSGLRVEQLRASKSSALAVALVLDVSNSTRGPALAAAKAAALDFVRAMPENVRVGVFTFGGPPSVAQDFTTNKLSVEAAINALDINGATTMYDGILLALDRLERQFDAQPNMLIFSDGDDTASETTLNDVIRGLRVGATSATTVLLRTRGVNEDALRRIAGAVKGGRYLPVANPQLLAAAFTRVAQALASQYVLTYRGGSLTTTDLEIGIRVSHSGFVATDRSVVLNERAKVAPAPVVSGERGPLLRLLANDLGFWIGIAAAFLGVLAFLSILVSAPASRGAERLLQRRLKNYGRVERQTEKVRTGTGILGSSFGRRAVELVEKVPVSKKFDESVQREIDQAGWPLRSSEFLLIQFGAAAAGIIVGAGLFQRWWLGIVLGIFGFFIPRALLANRIAKRSSNFLEQLPETLQLLAGSLQAGYGFLQALDTVAREAAAPTSTEFSRVLSEARLGMPLDEALDSMAERVGGEDFKWVVLAINIQRQVGGNLAALLHTVATTLREREMVRRQIKVLSAEGRLSAIILIALPFVLFGYLSIINPEYIGELTGATVGKIAIVIALVLIGIGAAWMRKIIKIDV